MNNFVKCHASDKSKEIISEVKRLLEEKGRESLNAAKNLVLRNKMVCREIKDALEYFMQEYWNDLTTPTLLCLSCEAVGGKTDQARQIAIPLIMISGAIDIHDDIIDQSKRKEGKLTLLGNFGPEIALITGDFLLVEGFTLLSNLYRKLPADKALYIATTIMNSLFKLANAEAIEISIMKKLQRGEKVKPEEYLRAIKLKAGDLEGLMKIGAILGGGSKNEIACLGKYGRYIGMLSILRDDLLDLKDLKEVKHRIRYECLPFALLCASQNYRGELSAFVKFLKDLKKVDDFWNVIKSKGFKEHQKAVKDIATKCRSIINKIKYNKYQLNLLLEFLMLT